MQLFAEGRIQLKKINDSRIVIENKPYFALDNNLICNGYSPQEIEFIMKNAQVGFCLDIGHAICSANAQKIEPFEYLNEFNKLKPMLYHLADGDFNGIYDEHVHLGKGSYNFRKILELLPQGCCLTIETDKNFKESLQDFEQDVKLLRKLHRVELL